jgi:hypothetical protein
MLPQKSQYQGIAEQVKFWEILRIFTIVDASSCVFR